MAHSLKIISKRSTFILLKEKGEFISGKAFNLQFLEDPNLENVIFVGFTATKKLGKSVKRNKAKRIMRELARKVITKYGKINSYYVLIAKSSLLDEKFSNLLIELKEKIND